MDVTLLLPRSLFMHKVFLTSINITPHGNYDTT